MTRPTARNKATDDLRSRAERLADSAPAEANESAPPADDVAAVMHELRVHQIELEMQNEELRRAQCELEISRARYQDLYEFAPVGYLSLDEDGLIVEANLTAASQLGVDRGSLIKVPFSAFVLPQDGDLFHKFRRRRIQDTDAGPYSCELRVKIRESDQLWVQLEATRARDAQGALGIRIVISDIDRRMAAETEREGDAEKLRASASRLETLLGQREEDLQTISRTLSSVIDVVAQVVETRDPYTAGHQRRVAELSTAIAADMGMARAEVEEIRVAALMHDVGKMSIPAEILSKPGSLSKIEFDLIKLHSEAGFLIIDSARLDGQVAEIIFQHHERCDGSGYPRGLSAKDLLPASKVLMVADVVEAMVSHRPYRPELGVDVALAEISKGAGRLFDVDVAASCNNVFLRDGFEFSEIAAG